MTAGNPMCGFHAADRPVPARPPVAAPLAPWPRAALAPPVAGSRALAAAATRARDHHPRPGRMSHAGYLPLSGGVRAVSGAAPRSHGPAGEGASLLKPLVAKRRAADHGAAPAPVPGLALGRAVAGPSEETSMT
jgi:hypothetical protein